MREQRLVFHTRASGSYYFVISDLAKPRASLFQLALSVTVQLSVSCSMVLREPTRTLYTAACYVLVPFLFSYDISSAGRRYTRVVPQAVSRLLQARCLGSLSSQQSSSFSPAGAFLRPLAHHRGFVEGRGADLSEDRVASRRPRPRPLFVALSVL